MKTEMPPVLVNNLFTEERKALLDLFASLSESEWQTSTVCTGWSVKDIGLHLLGDDAGIIKLSEARVIPTSSGLQKSWKEVVNMVNERNGQWVEATRRITNSLLIEFLKVTGEETLKYFESRDLYSLGRSVSWAGPEPVPVWLDIAREYTERWIHQQQIRDAINKPGLKDKKFMGPVIAAFTRSFLRVIPEANAENGTIVKVIITGDAGLECCLVKENGAWKLYEQYDGKPASVVKLDQESAWRYLTKNIGRSEIANKIEVEGNKELGLTLLDAVSIIA